MNIKQKIAVGTATVTLAMVGYIATWEGGGTPQKDGTQKVYIDKLAPTPLPTACGGITIAMDKSVKIGATFTQKQCDEMLTKVAKKELEQVAKVVKVSLTENQIIALVDFTHNLGIGALSKSTLLKKVDANECQAAANEFNNSPIIKNGRPLIYSGKDIIDKQTRVVLLKHGDTIKKWTISNGVPLPGLIKRRNSNAEMYRSGC